MGRVNKHLDLFFRLKTGEGYGESVPTFIFAMKYPTTYHEVIFRSRYA